MKNIITIIIISLFCISCGEFKSKDNATRTLENAGYSDVKVIKQHGIAPSLYGCADKDAVAFECQAKNPKGDVVLVTVCCGLVFKSCTIRH